MEVAKIARTASLALCTATTEQKNHALKSFKQSLISRRAELEKGNRADEEIAKKEIAAGRMVDSLYERIDCSTGHKFEEMLAGVEDVVVLDDPVGKCDLAHQMAKDLNLYRVSSPIGVILVIFEARPDAAVGILSLCLKSGNAAILKGGSEATNSLKAIELILKDTLKQCPGVPPESIQFVYSRDEVSQLYKLDSHIDLIVPRGSNELVRHIKDSTSIPVLGHADGICTVYIDKDADMQLALKVVDDSKNNYPAACNALETLLVHEAIVPQFLKDLGQRLKSHEVKYRADDICAPHLPKEDTTPAKPEDYSTEFLIKTMAVKSVKSCEEAVDHINRFGSHHTDVIVTANSDAADKFMRGVDSSGVYCNCSSRFADGYRYGFGAEVGISTNRIHARGPVGLEGLVTYKYRIYGKGQCVGQFNTKAPEAERLHYDHKPIALDQVKSADKIQSYQKSFFK